MARNMFSEIRHFPRVTLRLHDKREVPESVDHSFDKRGPHGSVPMDGRSLDAVVSGAERPRFFARPTAAFMSALPASIVLDKAYTGEGAAAAAAAAAASTSSAASAATGGGAGSTAGRAHSSLEAAGGVGAESSALVERAPESEADGGWKRSVAVQTLYRDGEAQTDPYTPAYVVKEGHDPEVLRIAHLEFGGAVGQRLPAGRAEVELIDRLRARRALEAALPPMTDEASFAVRKRMMQEQELADWQFRESELDAENQRRLTAIAGKLEEEVRRKEFESEQRLEELRRQLLETKEGTTASIQKRRVQTLRKLGRARQQAEEHADNLTGTSIVAVTNASSTGRKAKGRRAARDIIRDYADSGSRIYAPSTREGQFVDKPKDAARFEVDRARLFALDTLTQLEHTIPTTTLRAKVTAPKPFSPTNKRERQEAALGRDLDSVHELIRTRRALGRPTGAPGAIGALENAGDHALPIAAALVTAVPLITMPGAATMATASKSAAAALLRKAAPPPPRVSPEDVPAWRRPKERVERPPTPEFDDEDETADRANLESAVLLLQRLLRGRAVQNAMFEGKERRLALIEEIRQDLLTLEERAAVEADEARRRAEDNVRLAGEAAVDTVQGEVMAAAVDFFAKELVRSEELRRITTRVSAAEELRRRREAEESGRRQAEAGLRAKQDMVFRQLARVHTQSAASFVDDLLAAVVDRVAEATAEDEASARHGVVGPILDALEARADEPATVVRDLVQSFLLPEVERESVQRQVEAEQRKYLQAAREALEEARVAVEEGEAGVAAGEPPTEVVGGDEAGGGGSA